MINNVKLGEICNIQAGGTPSRKEKEYWTDGEIPWCKIKDFSGKYLSETEEKITNKGLENSSAKLLKKGTILYSIFATIGEVTILDIDATTNQAIAGIETISKDVDRDYLYYYLKNIKNTVLNLSRGVAQNNINLSIMKNIEVKLYEIDKQKSIANKLDKIQQLININKEQINLLDDLIKYKFINMFGNPIINDKNIDNIEMPLICEIIDGDRGKNYPKSEEFFKDEYCLFLNAKNVTKDGFSFKSCMYITKEKDEKLKKGKLKRGDIVLTTRGTVGNLAFYNDEIPYKNVRINSGMVILRMKREVVNEIFFIEQFKIQIDNIKNRIVNGSAQPQLPISKMNDIKFLIPDIKLQNQFAQIVKKVEKQKQMYEERLEELMQLQGSLNNQYFN